ncbi:MAG: phosphate acyltransferase PlsX [Dehalococcoidia bacterium]|nr:phosphate acyltransferase PlsX [Dehalococcoidia bacterium]
MKIIVDAMGGDFAPHEVVKGAIEAARSYKVDIVLVGKEEAIRPFLPGVSREHRLSVVNATQVVDLREHPTEILHLKPDSSIVVGMHLLRTGYGEAFVSAGSTGAVVAAATLLLGKTKGVDRPALGTLYPTVHGSSLLLDIGANADCRPDFLLQFAQLGSYYTERVLGVKSPRVGLLSNGEEEVKGNRLIRETHQMLRRSKLNFVGNVEGKDIPRGVADVVVTDGFTGNVVLKVSEGFGETLIEILKQNLNNGTRSKIAALLLRPALRAFSRKVDYQERGGALLLGVRGNVVVSHGRSQAKAIKSAIRLAIQGAKAGPITEISGGDNNGQAE